MLLSISDAAIMIGVSKSTLRRWEREGKIKPEATTLGGHRRYSMQKLKESFGLISQVKDKRVVAYARVSSHDQKEDLERQKNA